MTRSSYDKARDAVRKALDKLDPQYRDSLICEYARDLSGNTLTELADSLKGEAYSDEIRSLSADYRRRIIAGEFEDRDSLIEDIDQTIDGHHDVIYTACAQDVVRYSDNGGAYVDDFGSGGLVEGGEIQWSRMAYAAMRADLIEQLEAEGVDVNDDREEWTPDPVED